MIHVMSSVPAAQITSALLQVAQRRALLNRAQAGSWARAIAKAVRGDVLIDDPKRLREVILEHAHHADLPHAKTLAGMLPPNATVTIGRYRVLAILGKSRIGTTWLASTGDSLFALKVARLDTFANDSTRDTWLDDRDAPSLNSRYLAPVVECFTTREGAAATARSYVPGCDLAALMASTRKLSERRALQYARHICKGLIRLEHQSRWHGDLVPGNILVTTDGRGLLTDEGCHQLADTGRPLPGLHPLETANYRWAAPEQFNGDPCTIRSDIYSLGCLLYWMLSGSSPFHGDAERQGLWHRRKGRPNVRKKSANVSELTAKTIAKMMQVDPGDRYPTARALLASIMRNLERLPAASAGQDVSDANGESTEHPPAIGDATEHPPGDAGDSTTHPPGKKRESTLNAIGPPPMLLASDGETPFDPDNPFLDDTSIVFDDDDTRRPPTESFVLKEPDEPA